MEKEPGRCGYVAEKKGLYKKNAPGPNVPRICDGTCNPWKMDLPDLTHCEKCVGVEEGIVRDVVATQIEQP